MEHGLRHVMPFKILGPFLFLDSLRTYETVVIEAAQNRATIRFGNLHVNCQHAVFTFMENTI